jgi:hypothetical protein
MNQGTLERVVEVSNATGDGVIDIVIDPDTIVGILSFRGGTDCRILCAGGHVVASSFSGLAVLAAWAQARGGYTLPEVVRAGEPPPAAEELDGSWTAPSAGPQRDGWDPDEGPRPDDDALGSS